MAGNNRGSYWCVCVYATIASCRGIDTSLTGIVLYSQREINMDIINK